MFLNIVKNKMLKLNEEESERVIGYILYDLFEAGILNKKGRKIANGLLPIPPNILKELSDSINICLEEKQEDNTIS